MKDTCCVLMPFNTTYDAYYSEIYKPAIENCGLRPVRADDLSRVGTIVKDIWEYIQSSKIVVADISGLNPNVMYELGLAHAIAKPAIIISDSIESVPFDLRLLRILLYNINPPSPNWAQRLQNNLEKSIEETLAAPLEAVMPAFLNINYHKVEEISEVKSDIIEIKQMLYRQYEQEHPTSIYSVKQKLDPKDYAIANDEAHNLLYIQGWDIGDIKQHLMAKYNISSHLASDLLHGRI